MKSASVFMIEVDSHPEHEHQKSRSSLIKLEIHGPSQAWAVLNRPDMLQTALRLPAGLILKTFPNELCNIGLYVSFAENGLELDAPKENDDSMSGLQSFSRRFHCELKSCSHCTALEGSGKVNGYLGRGQKRC